MDAHLVDRRRFLLGAAAATGAVALGVGTSSRPVVALDASGLFALGVASGDPLPDAVVLWTRLIREVYEAGSMSSRPVPVDWQVAHDPAFRRIARSGVALARPELAHSVHVDVRGLQPGRGYFYRFRARDQISPVGRTRTTPSASGDPRRLRFGVVNCQDLQNGYWPAYWGLADEDLDLVLHLGDYIYEYDPASAYPDRRHVAPTTLGLDQLVTLADYRNRHAQYKSDPALQAAHAAFPWVVTWDDHETENNYAGVVDEIDDSGDQRQSPEQFALQRAAAYQAYWEHMPLRVRYRPGTSSLGLYRRFDLGRLARISVLDTRQYRTDQPGGFPNDLGSEAAGTGNAAGTLTGGAQERWLDAGLHRSGRRWNVIAQQVMMSRTRFPNPTGVPVPPTIVNLDQWDGYAPQRARLLEYVRQARVANPVVLAGDIHSTWFSDLKQNFDDPESATVATEFVAPSMSSDFPAAYDAAIRVANPTLNPHVKYYDGALHGYLRCDVTQQSWRTDVRVVDTISVRDAPVRTSASYAVEAGRPGLHPA